MQLTNIILCGRKFKTEKVHNGLEKEKILMEYFSPMTQFVLKQLLGRLHYIFTIGYRKMEHTNSRM